MSENTAAPAPSSTPAEVSSQEGGTEDSVSQERSSPGTPSKFESPKAAQTKAPAQKEELFELTIDGELVKMTKAEIKQYASLGKASDKRFKEAAQMRKQAESVIGRLRNPDQVIEALLDPALGLSKDQIREKFEEWYSKEFIEPESLTPEQKKLREAEAKLKKYEEDEKSREAMKAKEREEAMTAQARQQIETQIVEALETSGLPKTNFTIRRLAYWMERNHANGYNAPTEVVVNQVKNEINTSIRDLVEASDGDVLIKLLGDNVIQKLRKYDLEQLRKMKQPAAQPTSEPSQATPGRDERGKFTSSDVNQRLRELQRTGRY